MTILEEAFTAELEKLAGMPDPILFSAPIALGGAALGAFLGRLKSTEESRKRRMAIGAGLGAAGFVGFDKLMYIIQKNKAENMLAEMKRRLH